MDDRRFDALARSVAGSSSRRSLIRGLAGAAVGGFLAAIGRGEAAAGGCKNNGDCRACQKCDRNKGEKQGRCRSTCRNGEVCCAGRCGQPGPECCTRSEHCGPERGCMTCQVMTSRCEPLPDGRQCGECKRCKGGACTEPDPVRICDGVCCDDDSACTDDGCCPYERSCGTFGGRECCPEGERCTSDDGCCPKARACGAGGGAQAADCCDTDEKCIDGACCPDDRVCRDSCCPEDHQCRNGRCCRTCGDACCGAGQACIDGGFLGDTFCCNKELNTPCGDNGDGTFDQCCSKANEECCGGTCKPKGSCQRCTPPDRMCGDNCCPASAVCCNGRCCPDSECCNGRCVPRGALCCQQSEVWCQESGKEWCCDSASFCCGKVSEGYTPTCCPPDYPACVDDLRGNRACCKSFQDRVNCIAT